MNNIRKLLTRAWWKAAGIRAARTALVLAVPYFGALTFTGIPWEVLASTVGFGALSSLITSLAGIAEVEGTQVSWWYAITERVVKTFAQGLLTGFGTSTLFEQVDWSLVLQSAAIAAAGSALLAFLMKLPEAQQLPSPVQPVASVNSITVNNSSSGTTITSDDVTAPPEADAVEVSIVDHEGAGPA